jgi:hypothetical protein
MRFHAHRLLSICNSETFVKPKLKYLNLYSMRISMSITGFRSRGIEA